MISPALLKAAVRALFVADDAGSNIWRVTAAP
jgi:hypothetical protein